MRNRVILLIAAALLIGRTAGAQPAPWEPERLTPGWVFTPSIVVGGLWDSNVTLRAVHEPIQSEWVGLLNPRGEIDFNGRRTHMNVGYSGALEAYRQFSELNRYEQFGRFELRQQATEHLQLFSTAGYSKVPTTDRLDIEAGVLPFIGIGSRHADVSGGFQLQTSPRTHVEGQVSVQAIRFERGESSEATEFDRYLRNGHSWSPMVGVMHSISERVAVGASWNYRHAAVGVGLDEAVFDVQSETAEVAFQTGPHTTIRGGAGASYLTSSTEDLQRWGPAYHAGIDHLAGRVSVAAKYEHAFVPSIGFGGLNANQRVSASAHVPLGNGRWTVSGSLAYGEIAPVDQFGLDFTLHSLWSQGTVGYQLTRWLRTEGFVNRTHQTSTARGLVDRTRVGIEFVTSKPVRIQ
jgi:hypothetical protein